MSEFANGLTISDAKNWIEAASLKMDDLQSQLTASQEKVQELEEALTLANITLDRLKRGMGSHELIVNTLSHTKSISTQSEKEAI